MRRLCGSLALTLMLVIVALIEFSETRVSYAQADTPKTVQDFYLLMPKQYDK
jgi:hypothetical protein